MNKLKVLASLLLSGVLLSGGLVAGPASLKEEGQILEVENDSFMMKISPSQGGRLVGFRLKAADLELVTGKGWGLFCDMFSQQEWPGELQNQPYELEVLNRGPEEVTVKLSRLAVGQHKGAFPALEGIRVEKTYTVRADSPNLRVKYRLVNTTSRGKAPAFWVQSLFVAGPDKQGNVYFRPSSRGVDFTFFNFKEGKGLRPDDVRDPVDGWLAALNPKSGTGLLFLMDYNYTRWLYNCQTSCTTEWFYDKVIIPAGQYWETEVICVPLLGMESVAHATNKVVLQAQPDTTGLDIKLRATDKPVTGVILTADSSTAEFPRLGVKPESRRLKLERTLNPAECVIPFKLAGGGADHQGELVFSSQDIAVAILGGLGEEKIHRLPIPAKRKHFLKPESMERWRGSPPKALVLDGVYHRQYQTSEALDSLGWDKAVGKAGSGQWTGLFLSFWPEDYGRMMGYDLVVLNDLDPGAVGPEGMEMLREYVSHGGALLIMGGPYAFPNLDSFGGLLPVEGKARPQRLKDGRLKAGGKLAEGLDFDKNPSCFWAHGLTPKQGAEILLKAGDAPLLVVGDFGKGKVAVFLGTTLGEGDGLAFWEWNDWPRYLSRLMKLLSPRE